MTSGPYRFEEFLLDPGDRLVLTVEVLKHKGAIWKAKGTATVDGVRVAEGEFLATVVDKDGSAAAGEPAGS